MSAYLLNVRAFDELARCGVSAETGRGKDLILSTASVEVARPGIQGSPLRHLLSWAKLYPKQPLRKAATPRM